MYCEPADCNASSNASLPETLTPNLFAVSHLPEETLINFANLPAPKVCPRLSGLKKFPSATFAALSSALSDKISIAFNLISSLSAPVIFLPNASSTFLITIGSDIMSA